MGFDLTPIGPSEVDPTTGLTEKEKTSESPFYDLTPIGPSVGEEIGFYGGQGGFGKSKFDKGILPSEISRLDQIRAQTQTTGGKAFNAVVGGIASGVLTAIEDIGYIADVSNNVQRIAGMEEVSDNWMTSLAKKGKEGLERVMPIYRRDPSAVFDWSDPGFYFSSLKGILDSAVGFAIPGAAATKVVGAAQKAMRTKVFMDTMKASKRGQQMINSGLSGYITNFGEGKMMAVELFETSMVQMEQNLYEETLKHYNDQNTDGQFTPIQIANMAREDTERQLEEGGKRKEFAGVAGEQADTFMNRNKMFALTDAVGLHGLYKGKGFTRGILDERSLKAGARRLVTPSADNLILQAGKEGLEEIGQNVLQMEGEYQAAIEAGLDVTATPEDFAERVYGFATSDKAMLEGLMGVFGGGPQRILTEAATGNLGRSSKDAYRRRFEEQQEQIKKNTEFLNTKLASMATAQVMRSAAIKRGEDNLEELIKDSEFLNIVTDNFQKGTTANLERQLKDIAGMSPEQAQQAGFEGAYKEQAEEQLQVLRTMENEYLRFSKYENQRKVFFNRQTRKLIEADRQRLTNAIDDLAVEIDNQATPDEELVSRKEDLEKQRERANEIIDEKDKEYRSLVSPKTQRIIRDQFKRSKKAYDQKVKNDKAEEKASKEEEKVNAKKARAEKKNKRDDDDVRVSATVQEPSDEVDDAQVADPSIFDLRDTTPDANNVSKDQVDDAVDSQEAEERAKISSKELLRDLEDEFGDQLESQALTEGEGLSPRQRRLGLLENMIEDLKVSRGEDIGFNELIDFLSDEHGANNIKPVFGLLESIYKQYNAQYSPTDDFDAYRKLTSDERRELEGGRKAVAQDVQGQQTSQSEQKIDDSLGAIEANLKEKEDPSNPFEEVKEVDHLRVKSASGIVAYLSRLYEQTFRKGTLSYKETTDELNKDIQTTDILTDEIGVGTEVTLKVEEDENQDDYAVGDFTKPTSTWGANLDDLKQLLKKGTITEEEYQQRYEEQVPIAIYAGDQKIGYLHKTDWINETNVSGDIEKDKQRNRDIRKEIVAKREFKTKINNKTTGYLAKSKDGKIDVAQALPDTDLVFTVGSKEEFALSRTEVHTAERFNKEGPQKGVTYVHIPIGGMEIALPLSSKKLSENNQVVDTIMTVMDIFINDRRDEKSERVQKAILKDMEMNIWTSVGFTEFVETFINNFNTGKAQDVEKFFQNPSFENYANDGFLVMQRQSDNDVSINLVRGLGSGYTFFSKGARARLNTRYGEDADAKQQEIYNRMRGILERMYHHTSLDQINKEGNVVLLDENGEPAPISYKSYMKSMTQTPYIGFNIGTNEKPNWVYGIQPVIDMDFSMIDGSSNPKKATPVDVKAEAEAEIEERWKASRDAYIREQVPPGEAMDELSDKKIEEINKGLKEIDSQYEAELKQLREPVPAPAPKEVTGEPEPEIPDGIEDYPLGMNPNPDELESFAAAPLTEDAIQTVKDKAEVTFKDEEDKAKGIKGVIISEMTAAKQSQVVDFMRSQIVNELYKNKRVKRSEVYNNLLTQFKKTLAAAERNLARSEKAGNQAYIDSAQTMIDEMNLIIDNYDRLVALTDEQIARVDSVKRTIDPDSDEETEEEKESQSETANWADNSVFTMNPSDGLAPQIKQFLSGVGQWKIDRDGKVVPDNNYLGLQKTLSYQSLYNILQRLTPNLPPRYDSIMNVLRDLNNDPEKRKTYPFLGELITKLDGAEQQIKNQFVSGLTNHNVDMRFIQFSQNAKTGRTELVEFQSNRNAVTQVVLEDWFTQLITETAQPLLEDPSVYVIPEADRNRLMTTYNKWVKDKTYPPAELRQWLQELGITLSDQTFNDLMKGQIRYSGKKRSVTFQMTDPNGIFKVLADNIKTREDASLLSGNRLTDESVIKSLARHEAEYALYSHSNSHRTGNKTVYSYSQNKYLVNRIRELKAFVNGTNPLLEELAGLSFNGIADVSELSDEELATRGWIGAMMAKGGDNPFVQNFDRWVFSLEPLKKKKAKTRDNAELHKLSEAEIEVAKIGMLHATSGGDKSGKRNRIIKILYPTTSDKTTVMGLRVIAQDLKLDENGNITLESIEKIFDLVVQPEIDRIRSFESKVDKGEEADIKEYKKGAGQFLLFPEMNIIPNMFLDNGKLNPNIPTELVKEKIGEYFESLVSEKMKFWKENGIGEGEANAFLDHKFIAGDIAPDHNPMKVVNNESKTRGAAADMVFQYLIANAEIAKVFTGDPAIYFKQAEQNKNKSKTDQEYNFVADAEETYNNMGKRLAADIAPGYELAEADTDFYTQIFIADNKSSSEIKKEITKLLDGQEAYNKIKDLEGSELTTAVKGLISEKYYSFDGTDAQEYTTWKEHLHVMRQAGELSDADYHKAYKSLDKKGILPKELIGKVMQPMKPVYVDNVVEKESDVERRIYIKSSAFPLLPELTKGTDLENLRLSMEKLGNSNKGNGRVRAAYSTAVKLGNVSNPASIYDKNGRIFPSDQLDFSTATKTLNRKGFRIQQKVPFDVKKTEVNKVTQASKNLLVNMLDVQGFTVPWINNGESLTGAELQVEYHKVYGDLHALELDSLKRELITTDKRIKKNKLRRLLQDEAIERGYPISDLEMLELDKELDFIPFSPSSNKFEALLNSIVTSRVIRLKLPGKSYVLGSEEGFQETRLAELTEEKAEALGIVTTSNFKGKLRPARLAPDGKTRLPAQAIIPWKLRDQNGDFIDMEKYIIEKDGKKMLDRSKVPSEVLQMFGMRIPNQGPNSQSWIEIVGFLPEASGDLFIAVKDYVVQMGSDFDVDKLYTYHYNLYEDEGFVRVHRREDTEEEKRKALQNKIIDVHIAIHKNPDKTVQKQIANPLGFWKLKDDKEPEGGLANEIEKLRRGRETDAAMFTGLSDDYQRRKFKNAAAGKSGVGVFSNDSMFNAIVQGKGMTYMVKDDNGKDIPLRVAFGNKISDGDLSNPMSLDGVTFKSDVIAGYQSGAVDNEKEQILDKVNINNHTYKVIKILNQLGFGEEVPLFLSQDIIIDYVNELERLGSSLTGYVPNREKIARDNVNKKYGILPSPREMKEIPYADEAATPEMMRRYIAEGPSAPDYTDAQAAFLEKFIELDGYGQTIQELQSAINPDSAGLGKSVMEAQLKEDQIYRLTNSPVENAERLVGEIIPIRKIDRASMEEKGYIIREGIGRDKGLYAVKSNTINGHAITYGLFNSNDWWGQIYEYNTPTVQAIMEKVEDVASGSNDTAIASKAKRRLEVWKELKSYIYSDNNLGLFDEVSNIDTERERLLYDVWDKKKQTHESLASFIRRIQQTTFGKNNALISKLEVSVEKNGTPSQVTYRASAAENVDETDIYTAFVDLITSTDSEGNSKVIGTLNGKDYTKRDLGQDLVIYAYITGGIQEAVQFVKYIPAAYLTTIPFAQNLSDMGFIEKDFGVTVMEGKAEYYNIPPFVEQYIQHNPEKAVTVSQEDMNGIKLKNKIPYQFTLKKESQIALGEETRKYGIIVPPYLSMRAGNSESGMVVYRYDFKNGIYVQIDTLGTFGVSEYNKNLREGESQLSNIGLNSSPVSPLDRPSTPAITERENDTEPAVNKEDAKKKTGDDLLSNLAQGVAKEEVIENGFERSKAILNHILNYGSDSYQAVLADELMKNIEKLPPELQIAISNADVTSAGRYTYSTHTMTLFQKGIKGGEHGANKTFLHELLHGLTGYKIAYYLYGEEDSKEGRGIRAAVKNIPNFKLTEKDKAAIKSIDILRKQAEQAIVNTPELQKLYDDVKARLKEQEGISKSEITQFYGLTNALEFVSVALTDPGFQRLLNNIEAPSGKTFWEALRERLVRLLKSMGFDVEKGSILEQVVYDTLDLIEDREEITAKPVGVKVEHQDNITRSDLKNNPDKVYLFGDNLQEKGLGGQAKAMRGEPNAIGIPTKKKPSLGEDAFFTDDEYEGNIVAIENAFSKISDNTVVVIPSAGLGTGLARLEQKAPQTFAYLQGKLNELQPEIVPTEEIEPDRQLTLPEGKVITFSDEQYVGLGKIRKFLETSDNFFTLSGYAGTGKTTIIKKIIDESTTSIIVSAPTHKAKDKISETTGESGVTLHKLLGLKPNVQLDKFKPSDMQFQVLGDPTINEYGLVIIDEASMINKDLLEIIQVLVEGSDTKVIFMGDEAQIPPVGEKASEVFIRYMKEGTSHQLVETQRLTDGNPLGPVYDKMRDNLDKPDGGLDRKTAMNQRGEGIRFTDNFQTLDEVIREKFTSEEVRDNPDYVKFIAWRNETVTAVNKHIRKHIFGEDAQDFEVGDWLMGYTTIGKGGSSVYVQNSLDYKVMDVSDIRESRDGLKGREVVVKYFDNDTKRDVNQRMFLIDVNDEENFKKYIELHDKYIKAAKAAPAGRAKGQAWGNYYNFRGRNMSTAFVKRTVGDNITPDINYGYAITGHKSQGSTYKHVIVHETDINVNRKAKERNQIKYVALSRPTHTATVYTNKPIEEKNTLVDKPVVIPTEPAVTDDTDFKGISDNDVPTVEGSIFSNLIEATPESIISDEALDEYIKRCKK